MPLLFYIQARELRYTVSSQQEFNLDCLLQIGRSLQYFPLRFCNLVETSDTFATQRSNLDASNVRSLPSLTHALKHSLCFYMYAYFGRRRSFAFFTSGLGRVPTIISLSFSSSVIKPKAYCSDSRTD
jgi:hypothetical protein